MSRSHRKLPHLRFFYLFFAFFVCNSAFPQFSLASNNKTILCPNVANGSTGTVNGVVYTKVNRSDLQTKIAANQDVSCVCTTGITDMSSLFNNNSSFNQDISSWDTSSVSNMQGLFQNAGSFNQDIGYWDISSMNDQNGVNQLFDNAGSLNQDLSYWCFPSGGSASNIYQNRQNIWGNNNPIKNNSSLRPRFAVANNCISAKVAPPAFEATPTFSNWLNFNGSSAIGMTTTSNVTIGNTDQITVEAWFKVNQIPNEQEWDFIVSRQDDWQIYLYVENGNLYVKGRIRQDFSGQWPGVTSDPISTDTWYHVALTADSSSSSSQLKLYINGQLQGTDNFTRSGNGLTDNDREISIGGFDNYGVYGRYLTGQISDVRIWNTVRTQSEISSNLNQTVSTDSSLLLYYKLNEGSGSTYSDSSGNSISGSLIGGYQWMPLQDLTTTITSSDSDNLITSGVVTLTATFSENMSGYSACVHCRIGDQYSHDTRVFCGSVDLLLAGTFFSHHRNLCSYGSCNRYNFTCL